MSALFEGGKGKIKVQTNRKRRDTSVPRGRTERKNEKG